MRAAVGGAGWAPDGPAVPRRAKASGPEGRATAPGPAGRTVAGRLRLRFPGPSGGTHFVPVPSLDGFCAVPRAPGCCPFGVALRARACSRLLRSSPRPFGARSVCSSGRCRSGFSVLDPTRSVRRPVAVLVASESAGRDSRPPPYVSPATARGGGSASDDPAPDRQPEGAPPKGRGELRAPSSCSRWAWRSRTGPCRAAAFTHGTGRGQSVKEAVTGRWSLPVPGRVPAESGRMPRART